MKYCYTIQILYCIVITLNDKSILDLLDHKQLKQIFDFVCKPFCKLFLIEKQYINILISKNVNTVLFV